ncbi:DUF5313 family protein [Sphaerisporangium sp. NPDC005288]|uniref:DUF5313 family protein n=1 Tax=Sphaerisporangium sp. NPDC005288 TaxID=3155114 RepID=UPI0033B7D154
MDAYERAARRLMLAYPQRFREYRGDELLATLQDLAEPGQSRPTLRDSLDTVRGGIALRFREHPRLVAWLRYRLLDQRLPYEYRWWARDDLLRGRRAWRATVRTALSPVVVLVLLWMTDGPRPWGLLPAVLVGPVAVWVISWLEDERRRRKLMALHEFRADGTPMPPVSPGRTGGCSGYPRPTRGRRAGA